MASLLFYDMTHTIIDIKNLNENRLGGQRHLDTDFVSVGVVQVQVQVQVRPDGFAARIIRNDA